MKVLFALIITLALIIPALAGFSGDGFGTSGFFQYIVGSTSSSNLTTPVFSSYLLPSSGTSTEWGAAIGTSLANNLTPSSNTIRRVPIPIAGTLSHLYANLNAAQNTSPTPASVVSLLNGTAGNVTCNFTASSAPYSCNDSTHSDTVAAGTLFQWQFSAGTGPWAQVGTISDNISYLFTASGGQQGMMLSGPSTNAPSGSTVVWYQGFGTTSGSGAAADINVSSIMPAAGQITGIYAIPNATENTVPHIFVVCKNGTSACLSNPTSGVSCTAVASSAVGCCANLTGSGTIGGVQSCSTISALSVSVGDTISVLVSCATGTCAAEAPGISLIWVPSVTNQVPITVQWEINTTNGWAAMSDNFANTTQNVIQIAPYLSSTMTFSNFLACTAVNPGGSATRTITAQSGSLPNTLPSNVSGGSAITMATGNACPGANSGTYLGGNQDTTHTWTATSGNSLDYAITSSGSPASSLYWKLGIVATVP